MRSPEDNIYINDIGCNVGQFLKGLKENSSCSNFDYLGMDISETYLRHARDIFADDQFNLHDISVSPPRACHVTVCSATLEHILSWEAALVNILNTTKQIAYVRTVLGERYERSEYTKSAIPYWIQQFQFDQIGELALAMGFKLNILRDQATDSIPQYLGCGVTRTQFILELRKH